MVTADGGEIGRAQGLQAAACGLEPEVAMNPILLKPGGETHSHLLVRGRPDGEVTAMSYPQRRDHLRGVVLASFDELAARHDVVVCEGAGGAAEINLRRYDLVNLGLARERDIPVVVVGTIALGAWAVHSGLVAAEPDGETEGRIDVPSGRVIARVRCTGGRVSAVTFRNVPSWVVARSVPVPTSRGHVTVDVAYGGAIYATLPAAAVGLAVTPEHYGELIAIGREIKWALNEHEVARHPSDERLSGIYGTILVDDLGELETGPHQRNVTVFADGEVDRSPCGSGTSARLALLAAEGRVGGNKVLTHDSIVGSRFIGRVVSSAHDGVRQVVIPEVTGTAFRTGEHTFVLDPDDDLGTGFVLR